MSIDEYRAKYRTEFLSNAHKAWFVALLDVFKQSHPLTKLKTRKEGDKLHGAVLLLSEIDGYQQALDVFSDIEKEAPVESKDPPNDYPPPDQQE